MAQGRSSGSRRSSGAKSRTKASTSRPAAAGSQSTAAKRSAAAKKAAATRKSETRKRSTAAKKGAATRTTAQRSGSARKAASSRQGSDGLSSKNVAELRDAISQRVIAPLDLVMLTRERIEDAVNDAVSRGRVTADDAQDLVSSLLDRGRKQTNDVLSDLEQLMGRGKGEIEGRTGAARKRGTDAARKARQQVETATSRARKEAAKNADPVIAKADQARRAAGLGPSFPVSGYDDLTVAQVQDRLDGLNPAELRKVRDYERRHANRKTVLSAIEDKLS